MDLPKSLGDPQVKNARLGVMAATKLAPAPPTPQEMRFLMTHLC
jgi:hypothetical protein